MDERVLEWEEGLPCLDDLTPLSQSLIPPELLSAFSLTAEPPRTVVDVNRASNNTLTSIRGQLSPFEDLNHNYSTNNNNNHFKSFGEEEQNPINIDNEDAQINNNNNISVSNDDNGSSKCSKRPRLVWTPQLHKRFVDVVGHLGIKNAVPKTIMQLMNVEGLTRENVASHLQKYRLYLKRMQGLSDEGPSASDNLFASTPVPQSLRESNGKQQSNGNGNGHGHVGMMNPMSYPPTLPQMMHMPYVGMMAHGNGYHGYEAHHQFGSFSQYHNHVAPNDN